MIQDNIANVVKVKVWDKIYDANNLDFFEKKKILGNTPLVKWIDNEQSLNNMVKKWQRQSIAVEEWLKELWVKLDDLDAAQLKQFWELVRARNFDDARQAKWDNLKKEVSKKKAIVKADTPKLSPKAKKPLIKAEVASKVDDALPVWEKMDYIPWQDISDFSYDRYKKTVLKEFPELTERDVKRMYQTLIDEWTIKPQTNQP